MLDSEEEEKESVRVRSGGAPAALAIGFESPLLLLALRIGNADFLAWMRRDFGGLADGAGSVDERGARRLARAMPLADVDDLAGSLRAEKKARCRGHWIAGAGLLWKPSAGCRTGDVELPERNSGANWRDVACRSVSALERGRAYLGEVYARQALLGRT